MMMGVDDVGEGHFSFVTTGLGRSKNGVALLAYAPERCPISRIAGFDPAMTIKKALAEFTEFLIGQPVELARFGITLDLLIEAHGVKFLEPDAEFRKLVRGQFGDGLGDVIDAHGPNIAAKARAVECLGPRLVRPPHRAFR